jgi:hypothetical protein
LQPKVQSQYKVTAFLPQEVFRSKTQNAKRFVFLNGTAE